jgi:peptide deformylase
MIRPVLRMGDPRLIQPSVPVTEFDTPQLHALLQDMEDTMRAKNGAGIAAPQIGELVQVVNPVLEPVGDAMEEGWEGCLSVPGMRGVVPRYAQLRYRGFDQYGNPIDRTVTGFHARVVQHETDHLKGILYPMRIRDLRTFGFNEELFPGQDLRDD